MLVLELLVWECQEEWPAQIKAVIHLIPNPVLNSDVLSKDPKTLHSGDKSALWKVHFLLQAPKDCSCKAA